MQMCNCGKPAECYAINGHGSSEHFCRNCTPLGCDTVPIRLAVPIDTMQRIAAVIIRLLNVKLPRQKWEQIVGDASALTPEDLALIEQVIKGDNHD